MIVVRVELVSVKTEHSTEIARMHICNDATGTSLRGNYKGSTFRGRSSRGLDQHVPQRLGTVCAHPRQDQHVWDLVAKMLAAMGYGDAT